MTIKEILAIEDIGAKVNILQQRATAAPNVSELLAEWDSDKHAVMDKEKRKDKVMLKKQEKRNDVTGKLEEKADYEPEPVNRIPIPLEQDIVNIHTSFTVGIPPQLKCEPNNDLEKGLLEAILAINRKNKIKYQNKRIVRSWLSEMEVAEYWYTSKDKSSFWKRVATRIKAITGGAEPEYELKSVLWSPFRGDTLYPFFDESGNMIAFSRKYKVKETTEARVEADVEYFMTITDTEVYIWKMSGAPELYKSFLHGFSKIPVIYAYRPQSICHQIKNIRERLETLLSNFADAIDMCFFPYLILEGDIEGIPQKVGNNRMIKVENQGRVHYLDWSQTPEMIELEINGLWERAYSMTNTPRLSLENLKGLGSAPSGTAFRYTFMGAHLAVENHAEDIEEFLQRRYNFLVDAIGKINIKYEKAASTIDIEPVIVPYMIDDLAEKISNATAAIDGGIISRKTGIILAGIVDDADDELKRIAEEKADKGETKPEPSTK